MPTKKRVLLIEDHDDSRKALSMLLRRQGNFEVFDYDCCERAEAQHAARDIDIALLDVRLPGRGGDEFGKALRQQCPHTMIVFITGEAILEPLKEAIPDCFVMRKPVDPQVLLELLGCFGSKTADGSNKGKRMDAKAGPSNT